MLWKGCEGEDVWSRGRVGWISSLHIYGIEHAPLEKVRINLTMCFVNDNDLVGDIDSKSFTSGLLEKKVVW